LFPVEPLSCPDAPLLDGDIVAISKGPQEASAITLIGVDSYVESIGPCISCKCCEPVRLLKNSRVIHDRLMPSHGNAGTAVLSTCCSVWNRNSDPERALPHLSVIPCGDLKKIATNSSDLRVAYNPV
jgi:hypothetical protein